MISFDFLTTVLIVLCGLTTVESQFAAANNVLQTSASCDERFIYFRINFERAFRGLIYTENAVPDCIYINGSIQPQITYDIRIPLQGCNTRQLPNLDFENSVIVQQHPSYLEVSDKKYLLTCVPGVAGNRDGSFTVSFGGVTVDGRLPSTEVVQGTGNGGGGAIDHRVEVLFGAGPSGPPVNRPVSVGEPIAYVVRIADLRDLDARIGRCWANDGVSDIQLSDDRGCSLHASGSVWSSFRAVFNNPGRIFYNDIKAWSFPTSNRVNIFCNLHVCAAACPVFDCTQPSRSQRAVERAAAAVDALVDDDVSVLSAGFSVNAALAESEALRADSQRFSDVGVLTAADLGERRPADSICVGRLHFAVAAAFTLLAVLASLVFLFVFSIRFFGRPRAKLTDTASATSTLSPTRA